MKLFRSSRTKPEASPPAPTAAQHGVDSKESRAILRKCCDEGAPVVLMTNQLGRVCQGRMRMIDGDALFIELVDPTVRGEFKPLGICCAMFQRGPRAWTFLSNVRSHQVGSARPMVSVQVPEYMVSAHGRTSFRIPLADDAPLVVTGRFDGVERTLHATDISLGGMQLEIADGEDPFELAEDQEIELRLSLTIGLAPRAGGDGDDGDDGDDDGDAGPDDAAAPEERTLGRHVDPTNNAAADAFVERFDDEGAGDLDGEGDDAGDDGAAGSPPLAVTCVVRHVEERSFGVYFKGAVRGGQLDPPRVLRRLVKSLEAHWLRTRIH